MTSKSSSNGGPSSSGKRSTGKRALEEKQALATNLATEALTLYEAKNYQQSYRLLKEKMSRELLDLLPFDENLTCRLVFNLGYFYETRQSPGEIFLKKPNFGFPSLLSPSVLATVSESTLTFALHLASALEVKEKKKQVKNVADSVSLLKSLLWLEQSGFPDYNSVQVNTWQRAMDNEASKRDAFSSFRSDRGNDTRKPKPMMVLMDPRLVTKMLYFSMITEKEKFDRPQVANRYYSALRSYCAYFNYSYTQTLALVEYRFFTGTTAYSIRRQLIDRKNAYSWHIYGHIQIAHELMGRAMVAFEKPESYNTDYETVKRFLAEAEVQLAGVPRSLEKIESMVERETREEYRRALASKVTESKTGFLKVHRNTLLNRALLELDRAEHDGGVSDVGGAFALLEQALNVTPNALLGPCLVLDLPPLEPSLLLHFANSALALGHIKSAITILRSILQNQPESPVVCHRLADSYLCLYLDLIGDKARIVNETACWRENRESKHEIVKKEKMECAHKVLDEALRCYRETAQQVRSLLAKDGQLFEDEDEVAQGRFTQIQLSMLTAKEAKKQINGKLKANTAKKASKEGESIRQNYLMMHRTFLEEMSIQLSLNIVYCLLAQGLNKEALEEVAPLLSTNTDPNQPLAVSQSAYLLAHLYAGEAYFELGQGDMAAQCFDYQTVLAKFQQASVSQSEDSLAFWRSYLQPDINLGPCLPFCPDTPLDGVNLLASLFSYNFLTTLANMGRQSRLSFQLIRLRPNPIASKGCLQLVSHYAELLPHRVGQIQENFTRGAFRRLDNGEEQSLLVEGVKRLDRSLPSCTRLTPLTAEGEEASPLTEEQLDTLLLALYGGGAGGLINVTIPREDTANGQQEVWETTVKPVAGKCSDKILESDSNSKVIATVKSEKSPENLKKQTSELKLATSSVTSDQTEANLSTAASLASQASTFFSEANFTACYNLLRNSMTKELMELLPADRQMTSRLNQCLSRFYVERQTDICLAHLEAHMESHWRILYLTHRQALRIVSEAFFTFAVNLSSSKTSENGHIDAARLIEAFLWCEQAHVRNFDEERVLQVQAAFEKQFQTVQAIKPNSLPVDGRKWPGSFPLLEALGPAIVSKMLSLLLLTNSEKLGQPKEALRLYGILQRVVDYYSYPMPEGLAVLRYRLFSGQTVYSCAEEMPEAARQFTDLINLYRDLLKDTGILGPAEAAFPPREKAVNFEKSDKNLAKCENLLVALMEEKLTDLEEAIHEETKPAVKEATAEKLRTVKGQFLRIYRAILLNRGLLAWRRAEREGTNLERAYKLLYAAVSVNLPKEDKEEGEDGDNKLDDFTDYPVVLEPVSPLLLLNFANALTVAGNSKAAGSILRLLLPESKTITTSHAVVYHLLADCHLRQYLDSFGRDKEEVAEIAKQLKGGSAKLLDVNWFYTPGMALRLYWKARHAVVHLLEKNVLATEQAQATKQSEEYRGSVLGGNKAMLSKKAKVDTTTAEKWPEASPALTVAYLSMQRTFLEERLLQISLNIAYINLLQSDFEDASLMIEQILDGKWPNFKISPAAISQDVYLLAHLYAGEAAFESGNLQASLQKLSYESALSSFTESRSNLEDPSRTWRNYLNRQIDGQTNGLPNCIDKYTEEGSLLEGLFSYNYLTVLANTRQTERLPIRLARPRPNPVVSKRTVPFFVAYLPMIPCRIRQIEDHFARGRFTRQPKGESWRRKLESLQKSGKGLPACLENTSLLTKEQTDFLLHLAHNEKAINLVIPPDHTNRLAIERSKEAKAKRTGARLPVDPSIENEAKSKQRIDLSTLSAEEKNSHALDVTIEAYQTFKDGDFTKVNTILKGQLTIELFRLTPPHAHLDIRMWDAFSHFVLQRNVERLLAYLGGTVSGRYGPVGNLFDAETMDSVTRHVYNFAVILVSAKESKLDSWPASFAVTLLEKYLWTEQATIAGNQEVHASHWAATHAESAAKRHVGSAFRSHLGSGGKAPCLLELLDISQVVKILYFCIITLSEKFTQPKEGFKWYNTLRSYLNYFNYPLPRALSLTEYRLFTGQVHFSLSAELERLKNSLLWQISQLSLSADLTAKLKGTVEKVVILVSKRDYKSANRLLLELDRQLLVKKKDLAKVETIVEREADEGMKILLGERLIEAKAAYLNLVRDIVLYRALLAWHHLEADSGSIQKAFELLAEALSIRCSPEPYSATIGPIRVSLLLHLANTSMALEEYSIAISILERCLPYAEDHSLLVSHRLGDCYLRQYLDLIQDDARISREIARWKENNHLPFRELEDIPVTEASTESLKRARAYYEKAKEQVSSYLKCHFLEGEERKAEASFDHYQKVIFGCTTEPPSQDNCGEERKPQKGKTAKKATKKGKGKKGKKGKSSKTIKKVELIQDEQEEDKEDDGKADDGWVDDDEDEDRPSVVRNLDQDYVSMHRTFLEEMYVQLTLNLAYCKLIQRHYHEADSELLFLTLAPIPGGSKYAVSQPAYLLACLYQGEAMYENGQGKKAAAKFAYASVLRRPIITGGQPDKRSIWRSGTGYLTPEPSTPKTRSAKRLLENVFAYNYLTTLGNMGERERQPGPRLVRLRPNSIASKNTVKLWLQAEKMLEFRQGQIRSKLADGGFSWVKGYLKVKKEGEGESELEYIKRFYRASHPRVPVRVQQRQPLTAEQQDQLLLIVFSQRAESANECIPWDEKNSPLNGETENQTTMNGEPSERQVKSSALNGLKPISPKDKETKPEIRVSPTKPKEPEKCQTLKEMVTESEETEPEFTVVEELESVNRFANLKIGSENAEKLKEEPEMVQIENEIQSNISPTIDGNVSVEFVEKETSALSVKEEIEPLDGVQPEVEAEINEEGAETESNYVDSVTEGSANWDSVLKDFSDERWDLSEEEEDYTAMDVKIESKWAYLDEALELGADDEDDAFEGSDKWDSACPDNSEVKMEEEDEENVEWDDPQEERLENDTFFGLPPAAPPVITQKVESPVVTLSSTAVSPKALEATNEIANLLNKFKLENSDQPETPLLAESQLEASFPPQAPAPVGFDLAELSALLKSLPEFNSQPPQGNQSLLSRYLNDQADGASTRASTPPPPGGFPFGPIGPPPTAVINENLYANPHLEEKEEEDLSNLHMRWIHHNRLMEHYEKERKAHERMAKVLLAQIREDKGRSQSKAREAFEFPSGQQGDPSLSRFTDWRQSSPNLCQTMFGMPDERALFRGSQLGASTSMQGIDSLSMAPNFASPFSCNYPSVSGTTGSNSFGLSIDLNKDYFASPRASGHSSVEPNLGIPPPPPAIWAQAPLRPPPGIGRPQTSPDRLKEPGTNVTLSNLFGSLQMQKPN